MLQYSFAQRYSRAHGESRHAHTEPTSRAAACLLLSLPPAATRALPCCSCCCCFPLPPSPAAGAVPYHRRHARLRCLHGSPLVLETCHRPAEGSQRGHGGFHGHQPATHHAWPLQREAPFPHTLCTLHYTWYPILSVSHDTPPIHEDSRLLQRSVCCAAQRSHSCPSAAEGSMLTCCVCAPLLLIR